MEWDQIANRWAAMTNRLRNDTMAGPQTIDRLKTSGRAPKTSDRQTSETMVPNTVGDGQSLPSNE